MASLLNEFEMAQIEASSPLFQWPKAAADGAAATATAETAIGLIGPVAPQQISIGAIQFHPAAALTADPTNNATITVYVRRAAAPAVQVVLAVGVTAPSGVNSTGSWTAWQAVPLTVVAGAYLSAGDALTVVITKGGTGVVVPQGILAGYLKVL